MGHLPAVDDLSDEDHPSEPVVSSRGIGMTLLQRIKQRLTVGRTTSEEKAPLRSQRRAVRPIQQRTCLNVPTELLIDAVLRGSTAASPIGLPSAAEVEELSSLLRLQLRHELHESSMGLVDAFDMLSSEVRALILPRPRSSRAILSS